MPLPAYTPPDEPDEVISYSSATSWGIKDEARFNALLKEAQELVAPGAFLSDNLFTWCRNNSMFDDVNFVESWSNNVYSNSDGAIVWRRYILATMAFHAAQLEGDFVECGVFSGSGIKTVIDYLGGPAFEKTFWGYDTFDYHPAAEHQFEGQNEELFAKVCDRFNGYTNVRLIKGLIPDSFSHGTPERIAFLHIDLNHAESEIATLDALFDRMVPGAPLIFDDYEWASVYRQQKLAEDAWLARRDYRVTPLPTGQGLVIKR